MTTQRAAILLSLALAAPTTAEDPRPALSDSERVTVIDALVRLEKGGFERWASGKVTPKTKLEEFQVSVDGLERAVLSIEAFERTEPAERAPWRQLIYLDCQHLSTGDLRRAASLLHSQIAELTTLGPVEVVVADPAPRLLQASTRDLSALAAILSRLSLQFECVDLIAAGRDELLAAAAQLPEEKFALAAAAWARERAEARRSRVALALTLADPRFGSGAQKVLYLVHPGFDPSPQDYYGRFGNDAPPETIDFSFGDLSAVAAAYGWTTFPIQPAALTAAPRGVYLGRWLTRLRRPEEEKSSMPELDAAKESSDVPGLSPAAGVTMILRGERDPKKAERYLELGEVKLAGGDALGAAAAFRKAIYHFDSAPKAREREAFAWLGLARATEASDQATARRALEKAILLDPGLKADGKVESIGLQQRSLALADLAKATLGSPLATSVELRAALLELEHRIRVSFQLAGRPSGALLPLSIKTTQGEILETVAFTRSGTPEAIATARLLALADEELAPVFSAGLELDPASDVLEHAKVARFLGLEEKTPLRFSWLRGRDERALTLRHRQTLVDPQSVDSETLSFGSGWLSVVVEDLESGRWASGFFDGSAPEP